MQTPGVQTSTSVVVLPDVSGLGAVSDEALLQLQRESGAARRRVDAVVAAISGELARRSARELGQGGLAARTGARTPEKAVQQLTGVSLTEAKAFVTVGTAVTEESPWLAPVADAVEAGELSVATAAGIARGLGSPSQDVAADDLLDAAAGLVQFARDASPESTAVAARQARERLDVTRVADLEEHRRSQRSLTWSPLPDGTTRMTAILDPESAAIITSAIDTITSPRRGGPRFIDPTDQQRADALAADARTLPQLALDALVDIVRLATRASATDVKNLFGVQSPAVRIHVQAADLKHGTGFSYLEGHTAFLSTATAQRLACDTGWLPVLFDGADPIDVGHTQRLHTPRQRIAATAHWNGCPWGDCDRPPAMTEMHHIHAFDGTNTTLDNAIPLCRFHHMQLHNNRWHIHQQPHGLTAISPTGDEVPLRPKSPFTQ